MGTMILQYPDKGDTDTHEGKFLQLVFEGEEYLLFARKEQHTYHNQILARFLSERQLPLRWVSPEQLEVPAAALRIVGGGRFRADHQQRILELWDDSHAYGRFEEDGLAARIATTDHPWSAYTIHIR